MIKRLTPATIHPPLARYAHATEVPAGARWLVLSGQLGIAADGTVPPDARSQATICFENISRYPPGDAREMKSAARKVKTSFQVSSKPLR